MAPLVLRWHHVLNFLAIMDKSFGVVCKIYSFIVDTFRRWSPPFALSTLYPEKEKVCVTRELLEAEDAPTAEQKVRNIIKRYKPGSWRVDEAFEAIEIAKFCLLNDVEDSELVVRAITSFCPQDSFLINVRDPELGNFTTVLENSIEGRDETLLEYLLRHAVKAKWDFFQILNRHVWSSLKYKKDDIFFHFCGKDPSQVAALLRHGYVLTTCHANFSRYEKWVYTNADNTVLACDYVWRMYNKMSDYQNGKPIFSCTEDDLSNLRESFLLLLRSTPFPLALSDIAIFKISEQLEIEKEIFPDIPQHPQGILRILFPGTTFELNSPRTLKQLCRCSIRDCLFLNWMLPEGIGQLEVPNTLHSYLNLEC